MNRRRDAYGISQRSGSSRKGSSRKKIEKLNEQISTLKKSQRKSKVELEKLRAVNSQLQQQSSETARDEQVQIIKAEYQHKQRRLMRSLREAEQKIDALNRAAKQDEKMRTIKKLKLQVAARSKAVEVMKNKIAEGCPAIDREEINKFLHENTIGGPKRFRPKTVEELENLERSLRQTVRRLREKLETAEAAAASSAAKLESTTAANEAIDDDEADDGDADGIAAATGAGAGAGAEDDPGGDGGNDAGVHRSSAAETKKDGGVAAQLADDLAEQLEVLEVQLEAANRSLRAQDEEIERLHAQLRQLRPLQDKNARVKMKWAKGKETIDKMQDQLVDLDRRLQEEQQTKRQLEEENSWYQDKLNEVRVGAEDRHVEQLEQLGRYKEAELRLHKALQETQEQLAQHKSMHRETVAKFQRQLAEVHEEHAHERHQSELLQQRLKQQQKQLEIDSTVEMTNQQSSHKGALSNMALKLSHLTREKELMLDENRKLRMQLSFHKTTSAANETALQEKLNEMTSFNRQLQSALRLAKKKAAAAQMQKRHFQNSLSQEGQLRIKFLELKDKAEMAERENVRLRSVLETRTRQTASRVASSNKTSIGATGSRTTGTTYVQAKRRQIETDGAATALQIDVQKTLAEAAALQRQYGQKKQTSSVKIESSPAVIKGFTITSTEKYDVE